ncbi:MAG: hypothetical protein RR061_02580 [Muribaculaceae bacterium]
MNSKNQKSKVNKWLLWGVIILATLLVLWLTFFEYLGAVEEGDVIQDGNNIEQVIE